MPVLSNPKQEIFAQELAKGKTADEAYQRAGYKPNRANAGALRQKQHISERLGELLTQRNEMASVATEKAAEALSIDRQWVMARLKENAERAMQAEAVMVGGEPTGEYRYEGSVANRALELLGKEIGMFIDRKDITHRDGDLERLSDAELRGAIQAEFDTLEEAERRTGVTRRKSPSEPAGRLN